MGTSARKVASYCASVPIVGSLLSRFRKRKPTAIAYVDGFNLYRRCLKEHPEAKWLNLPSLMDYLLPDHDVHHVHYFTALIRVGEGDDPGAPIRQQTYIRALESTGRITVHYGNFRVDRRMMPKHPIEIMEGEKVRVAVRKSEEKGSDVNLAIRVLVDAHKGSADLYCILTNDSDQVTTIRTLQDEIGADVCWISPVPTIRHNKELRKTNPTRIEVVTPEALMENQFPEQVETPSQVLNRPAQWH